MFIILAAQSQKAELMEHEHMSVEKKKQHLDIVIYSLVMTFAVWTVTHRGFTNDCIMVKMRKVSMLPGAKGE